MVSVRPHVAQDELARGLLKRVGGDLGQICDQDVVLTAQRIETISARAAGKESVHISFRLRFHFEEGGQSRERWGTLLLPLPEAIALACYLLMVPDDAVASHRGDQSLDETTKDAMMEVGNFIGGGVDGCVRSLFDGHVTAKFGGCQGVRAGVRPAMPWSDGDELVLVEGHGRVGGFPEFPFLLMFPPFD